MTRVHPDERINLSHSMILSTAVLLILARFARNELETAPGTWHGNERYEHSDQSNLVRRLATQTLLWLAITGALLAAPLLVRPFQRRAENRPRHLELQRPRQRRVNSRIEGGHALHLYDARRHALSLYGDDHESRSSTSAIKTAAPSFGPCSDRRWRYRTKPFPGSYGGLTAGISIGVGGNANALVGGFGKSIFPSRPTER